MVSGRYLAGWLALLTVVFFIEWSADSASGGVYVCPPCQDGCICIPNARYFGHFQRIWRPWPDEDRPGQRFPQEIGIEKIPTPEAQVPVPLPKEEPMARPVAPGEGGILPPGADIQIDPGLPTGPMLPRTPFELEPEGRQQEPGIEVEPETLRPDQEPAEESPKATPSPTEGGSTKPTRAVSVAQAGPAAPTPPEPTAAPRQTPVHNAKWQTRFKSGSPAAGSHNRSIEQTSCKRPVEPWAAPQAWKPDREHSVRLTGARLTGAGLNVDPAGESTPLGLDGYCPVELVRNERWVSGDSRWAVTHRGRTYHLSGPIQHRLFRADPQRYAPLRSGCDPVSAIDENRQVPGQTDACVIYEGRLYMFAGAASLDKFRKEPKRYAEAIDE